MQTQGPLRGKERSAPAFAVHGVIQARARKVANATCLASLTTDREQPCEVPSERPARLGRDRNRQAVPATPTQEYGSLRQGETPWPWLRLR